MTNDNEYPKQIRDLQEQLKGAREKCKELEEKAKREERASLVAQDRMVGLEEKNRKLQEMITKVKNGNMQTTSNNDDMDQYDLAPENMNLQYKLQEAYRVNSILAKSRDVLSKTITQMKQKMDKVVDKYKQQIEFMSV